LRNERVLFIWDQTDTQFFSPGPASPDKVRPVVMSVGMERRDYGALASATGDMEIDVRIIGFSADTRVLASAYPLEKPANMSRRFYSWVELQQLYRDADIVVVSLHPNRYAAGVQGLMEGLASGRPVIVTATEGLAGYLHTSKAMRLVPPGDALRMREAIADLLARPEERQRMGTEALALAHERHRCEQYVATLASALRGLAMKA
ncbi:MAG: glycosyl transferase group 1, partial [Rhodoferax sp.]|nr:glycosyl transferase group 1 [Rhodoferax sp.]